MEERLPDRVIVITDVDSHLDAKGRWTRLMAAKVSLLVCPFWFCSELAFNLSLKYATVTVSVSGVWFSMPLLLRVQILLHFIIWLKLIYILISYPVKYNP